MADIGRSTLEHGQSPRHHELDADLESWGSWIRSVPAPHAIRSLAPSPAFRFYVTKYYADVSDMPQGTGYYDERKAEQYDRVISQLDQRLVFVLVNEFVVRQSSRGGARAMTAAGWKCSHTTYRRWVDDAKDELLIKLEKTYER